jgi:nucleotide-binding universal stress UspA family protein
MSLVVGFAPDKDDFGGLELAAMLARSSGQDIIAVTVVPAPWPTPVAGTVDREFEAWAAARGESAVAQATEAAAVYCLGVDFKATWIHGKSVAGALLDESVRRDASILVVGSGHDGRYGYVNVSSSADRLLHSSEIPVAIATRGFEVTGHTTVSRATCAFRGDEASRRTLTPDRDVRGARQDHVSSGRLRSEGRGHDHGPMACSG